MKYAQIQVKKYVSKRAAYAQKWCFGGIAIFSMASLLVRVVWPHLRFAIFSAYSTIVMILGVAILMLSFFVEDES